MAETQKESERKGVASFKAGTEAVADEELVVTINPAMGKIVKVEKTDKSGKRQELAEEEWAKFVGEDEVDEIETALEDAFEAGVAGVLGEEYEVDGEEADEDDEERALRRILIGRLLRRSVRRRLLQRLVLGRLLRHGSSRGGHSKQRVSSQKGA